MVLLVLQPAQGQKKSFGQVTVDITMNNSLLRGKLKFKENIPTV